MRLELREVKTSKSLLIEEGGAVFGREGGDAQIKLRDMGVSKKHARVYAKKGEWFIEDLGSSNGTYVNDQRIRGAVQLEVGSTFAMSEQQYEVVLVHPDEKTTRASLGEVSNSGLKRRMAQSESNVPTALPEDEATPPPTRDERPSDEDEASATGAPAPAMGDSVVTGAPEGRQGFARAAVKAFGLYAKAVPLMAVNPIGYVRKGIADQPHSAMGPIEIIAFALPANLFTVLLAFICGLIVQLVAGKLSVLAILPIVPLAVAVVASVLTGFLLHPVLGWLVRFLKGKSDERSRTNFFLMSTAASVLAAIPGALGTLIALVPVPFVNLLPILLSLAGTLIVAFVVFSWFVHFGVVKWFRMAILALGALACVGAAVSLVQATRLNIQALRGGVPVAMDAEAVDALKDAEARAAEATKAAMEAAAEVEGAAKPVERTSEAPPDKSQPEKAPPEKVPEPKAPETLVAAAQPAKVEPVAPPPVAKKAPEPAPVSYKEYFAQRQAVEKAIAEDPTVLEDKQLLGLYRRLVKATHEVDQQYAKQTRKDPSLAKVNERLREAEVFRKTAKLVAELHGRMFR